MNDMYDIVKKGVYLRLIYQIVGNFFGNHVNVGLYGKWVYGRDMGCEKGIDEVGDMSFVVMGLRLETGVLCGGV